MNWFKGSIPEAIATAKNINAIFVVYVSDKSELSKLTRDKINDGEICQVLSSSKFVAIEIENGTNDAIQFAQIYPLIVVPSLFFISPQNGIPLEVVGGNFECQTLKEKINKILDNLLQASAKSEPVVENAEENSDAPTHQAASNQSDQLQQDLQQIVTEHNIAAEASVEEGNTFTSSSSAEDEAKPSLEERVQRAKELLSQKQEQKSVEELEVEKQKEVGRRRQSQELSKAKQMREEKERMELGKQRRKEKEEDRIARERVKAQIAADRAERLARNALLKGESPPDTASEDPPEKAPEADAGLVPQNCNRSETARLKFRFPDNSSQLADFAPDSTLGEVRTYLQNNCPLASTQFRMVATLPPRSFTEEDMSLTLSQLGLTPSAIIIVKPVAAAPSVNIVPSGDGVMSLFWSMIAPLVFIFNYLSSILGFGERRSPQIESSDDEDAHEAKKPRTEGSYTTRNRPHTAYGRRGDDASNFLRREGNIHRINRRRDEDEDDENNTWNGNSTQQM